MRQIGAIRFDAPSNAGGFDGRSLCIIAITTTGDSALVLTAANSAAVAGMQRVFVDQAASANTNASVNASVALTASTANKFYYHVISY